MPSPADSPTPPFAPEWGFKVHQQEDREAEAAKIHRLRQLRLAAAAPVKPRRRKGVKTIPIVVSQYCGAECRGRRGRLA